MTASSGTSRYSAEDFETASVRSAAPSYVSEAPSYHSTLPQDAAPRYSPPVPLGASNSHLASETGGQIATPRSEAIGLPPIPALPRSNNPLHHNYGMPTWPTTNAPAAMHYRKVAERRVVDGRYQSPTHARRQSQNLARRPTQLPHEDTSLLTRPLEDPYLVGEEAAAEARRERIARETGSDILQREDRHWDWLLAQMRGWEERERSWAKIRRNGEAAQRQRLADTIGGRLMSTR